MDLKEQLEHDLHDAMRARADDRLRAIRMVKAAISNLEFARTDPKHPQHGQPVTEGDLLHAIEQQVKQRREAIKLYQKGNRADRVAEEEAEIRVLEKYLPQQLSREQIVAEVEQVLAELGTREFPQVMREAARRLKGRADGKLVNEVVRERTG